MPPDRQQYVKKTHREHVMLRPDTYVGDVEESTMRMWVPDAEGDMVERDVTFVPAMLKIFDEVAVNASDNAQRDAAMTALKVTVDQDAGWLEVWNNGRGIPIERHAREKCYVPELIFGHLLTGSNFNDKSKKTTGGRNGYGASKSPPARPHARPPARTHPPADPPASQS